MTFSQLGAKHGNFTTQEATRKTQQELFANEAELELSEEELNAVAGGADGMSSLRCSNGAPAVSACFPSGTCNLGYTCDRSTNYCCMPMSRSQPRCLNGSLGHACTQGKCAAGFTCQNNLCCR